MKGLFFVKVVVAVVLSSGGFNGGTGGSVYAKERVELNNGIGSNEPGQNHTYPNLGADSDSPVPSRPMPDHGSDGTDDNYDNRPIQSTPMKSFGLFNSMGAAGQQACVDAIRSLSYRSRNVKKRRILSPLKCQLVPIMRF